MRYGYCRMMRVSELRKFMKQGGVILCLKQKTYSH